MLCVAFVKNPYRWFILSKPVIFYFILYLFIFSCAGSSLPHRGFPLVVACGGCLRCDAQALHCGGFSCRRARARGLSRCGCQTPEHRLGSHGMRPGGSTACGIFPDQGLNPCLLPWQADSLLLSHQGRSPVWGFINSQENHHPQLPRAATIYTDSPGKACGGSLHIECLCTTAGGGPGRRTLRAGEVGSRACGSDAWSLGLCPLS